MFFDKIEQIDNIVKNVGTAVLCLKDGGMVGEERFDLAKFSERLRAILIRPMDGHISIDQVREVIEMCATKQIDGRFFIFENAESLRPEAANALLKLLEEPGENYHFVLLVDNPGALLPTIRSRAQIYAPLVRNPLSRAPEVSEDVLTLAKRVLVAKPAEIAEIAETLAKKKPDQRREYALSVVATTVELAYKSYFKTGNRMFITKIPGLMTAYDGIAANGNLKLQFVANLI